VLRFELEAGRVAPHAITLAGAQDLRFEPCWNPLAVTGRSPGSGSVPSLAWAEVHFGGAINTLWPQGQSRLAPLRSSPFPAGEGQREIVAVVCWTYPDRSLGRCKSPISVNLVLLCGSQATFFELCKLFPRAGKFRRGGESELHAMQMGSERQSEFAQTSNPRAVREDHPERGSPPVRWRPNVRGNLPSREEQRSETLIPMLQQAGRSGAARHSSSTMRGNRQRGAMASGAACSAGSGKHW
jgi:hypothetical protein